jgi:hypothetical protein
MVFGRQHANIHFSEAHQLRAAVQIIYAFPIEAGESFMKIYRELMIRPVIQSYACPMVLSRVNAQVDIAAGPETYFRIESSRRPAFD